MGATSSTTSVPTDPRDIFIQDIRNKNKQHESLHTAMSNFLGETKQYLSIKEKITSVNDAKEEVARCKRYLKDVQDHQATTVVNFQTLGQAVITAEWTGTGTGPGTSTNEPGNGNETGTSTNEPGTGTGADKWVFEEPKRVQDRERIVKEIKECGLRLAKKLAALEDRLRQEQEKEKYRQHEEEYDAISKDLVALKARINTVGIGLSKESEEKFATALQIELKAQEERVEKWKAIGAKSKDDEGWPHTNVQEWETSLADALKACSTLLEQKIEGLNKWTEAPVKICNLPHRYRMGQPVQNWDANPTPRLQLKDPTPRPVRDEFPVPELDDKTRGEFKQLFTQFQVSEKTEIRNQNYKNFLIATQGAVPTPQDRAYTEKEVKRAEASDKPCDIAMAGLARMFADDGVDYILTQDPKASTLRNMMMIGGEQTNTTKVISVFTEGLFKMSFEDFRRDLFAQKKVELEVRTLASRVFQVPVSEVAMLSFARGSDAMRFGCPGGKLTKERMEEFVREFVQKFQLSQLHIETMDIQQTLTLCPQDFDPRGDFSFPEGGSKQKRGGCDYFQPGAPWKRVGLRVLDCYENGNWIRMDGGSGEWAVGFHGSAGEGLRGISRTRTFFTDGGRQLHEASPDINPQSDKKDQPCGKGAYFANKIEISEKSYSYPVTLGNGKNYKFVFQCRLHPQKMRQPKGNPDFLIVNEAQHVRPYGICYKEC